MQSGFKRSLEMFEKSRGVDHPDVATALGDLGHLYVAQRRFTDARPLFERAIFIRERTVGADHPNLALALNNLGTLYSDQGYYADAEKLYKRSLNIYESSLGPNHPSVGVATNQLASSYVLQGRYADALPLVRKAAQNGFDRKLVHLSALRGAYGSSILGKDDAFNESFEVVQRAMSSAASNAINKLKVRFAAGSTTISQRSMANAIS
jgi:tetratricopeptide (TPR) repeat protein